MSELVKGPIADEETAPFQTEGKGGFSRVEKDNRKSAKVGSCRFAESVVGSWAV